MSDDAIDQTVFADLQDAMGSDFADQLVTTFLDGAPGMLADLKDAVARADADQFRRTAHSIKSNADVFGAQNLAEIARQLELSGLPEDPEAGREKVALLDAENQRAMAALRDLLNG